MPQSQPINIVLVEDKPDDAEQILSQLRQANFNPVCQQIETEAEYEAILQKIPETLEIAIIIASLNLPQCDGLRALALLQQYRLNIPVIILAHPTEEAAAQQCIEQGAADYLFKDRLGRLGVSVRKTLAQEQARQQQQQITQTLQESEERYRRLVELSPVGIAVYLELRIVFVNRAGANLLGASDPEELLGRPVADFIFPDYSQTLKRRFQQLMAGQMPEPAEQKIRRLDGTPVDVAVASAPITYEGQPAILAVLHNITRRKQAEADLQRERNWLHTLINNMPDYIYIKDTEGRFIMGNRAVARVMGASTPNQLIGKTDFDFYPEELAAQYHTSEQKLLNSGQTLVDHEEPLIDQSTGEQAWISTTKVPLTDEQGQPIGLVGIGRDITGRKQMETALKENEEHFRALIEYASDIITILDSEGVIQYESPSVEHILGYHPDELVGKNAFDFIHPDDIANVVSVFAEGVESAKETDKVECRFKHKDGSWRVIEAIGRNLQDDPVINGFIINSRDITERKQMEAEIQHKARELEALVQVSAALRKSSERAEIPPIVLDQVHDLLKASGSAVGIQDPATGEVVMELIRGERAHLTGTRLPAKKGISGQVIASGQTYVTEDVQQDPNFLFSDEVKEALAMVCTPLIFEEQTIGVLWASRAPPFTDEEIDLLTAIANIAATTLQRAKLFVELAESNAALAQERESLAQRVAERTAELQTTNAELRRALRLKDEFLDSISHELRTPLNAILGMSEILKSNIHGPLNQNQQEALDHIEAAGQKLLALITDVLDFAGTEAGEITLQPGPVSVELVCQSALNQVKTAAHNKGHKIYSTFDGDLPRYIMADEERLKQILLNLLDNAIKFTPAGGKVGLEVLLDDEDQIQFTVWDTGPGISPENISDLFQPFVQLNGSLARRHEGTGLGLALVARLTELHGGTVSVDSTVGQGSRFTVSLPLKGELLY